FRGDSTLTQVRTRIGKACVMRWRTRPSHATLRPQPFPSSELSQVCSRTAVCESLTIGGSLWQLGRRTMAVKLIDLQLIYGVAGAQAKFDDLSSQLVERDQPDADKVRIEQGDGGLDVFVGNLTDPHGLEVYQCKFFPQGLGDSQKDQI